MKVLVTGFDPFGGESINPAYEAVKMLPDEIAGAQIIKREIPTSFTRGTAEVVRQIELCQPDLVLNVGQAGGAAGLRVERVAINLADARIPDNDGAQPVDEPLVQDGAPAYFLPSCRSRPWCAGYRQRAIPASCLTRQVPYVCNAVMYTVLHTVQSNPHIRAGFVHVPYAASQLEGKAAGTRPCRWQTLPRPWQLPLKPLCRIRPI